MTQRSVGRSRHPRRSLLHAALVIVTLASTALLIPAAPGAGGLTELHDAPAGSLQARAVYLEITVDTGVVQRCSGTLVGPRVVLTAGHCLRGMSGARVPTRIVLAPGQHFPPDSSRVRPFGYCTGGRWAAPPQDGQALSPDDYGVVEVHRCVDAAGRVADAALGARVGWSALAIAPEVWPAEVASYLGYPNTGAVDRETGGRAAGLYRLLGTHTRRGDGSVRGDEGIPAGGSGGGLYLTSSAGRAEVVAVLSGRTRRPLPRLDQAVYRPVDDAVVEMVAAASAGAFDALPGGTATSLAP